MTDNANIKLDGNRMKDFTKTWDGMPMKNFRKNFYLPFLMAIGNIIMDGVACRDTVNPFPTLVSPVTQSNERVLYASLTSL